MTKRRSYEVALTLVLILLVAGALRLYDLGGESLWLDEGITVGWTRGPLSDRLRDMPLVDWNPPLYFLLLKGWMRLGGESEAFLRALSVAFSVAGVAVVFLVGLELRNAALGLAAAFFSAISYFLILYAREVRPYSLLVLLSATSYYFFIRMIRRGAPGGATAGYAASTALLLYTHYHGAFLVLAQLGTVACLWRRLARVRRRWMVALALAALAFSPWLPTFWTQLQIVAGKKHWWISTPTILQVAGLNSNWVAFPWRSYPESEPFYAALAVFPLLPLMCLYWALVFVGCFIWTRPPASTAGRYRVHPSGGAPAEETVTLALWLLVPVVVPFALSQIVRPIFWPRYIIGATPAFYLLAARGVVALNRRWLAGGLCLVILGLVMPGLLRYHRLPRKQQWNEVARVLEREARPGDLVVLPSRNTKYPFTYYYRGSLDRVAVHAREDLPEVARQLRRAMVGRRRLWLIISFESGMTSARALQDLLPEGPTAQHRFFGVTVILYEVPPPVRKRETSFGPTYDARVGRWQPNTPVSIQSPWLSG